MPDADALSARTSSMRMFRCSIEGISDVTTIEWSITRIRSMTETPVVLMSGDTVFSEDAELSVVNVSGVYEAQYSCTPISDAGPHPSQVPGCLVLRGTYVCLVYTDVKESRSTP